MPTDAAATVTAAATVETPPTPTMEDKLDALNASLYRMLEDQRRLFAQLGKSLISMHKEHQSTSQGMLQKIEELTTTRGHNQAMDYSPTASQERRPIYVTPAPTMPRFGGTDKHPVKYLQELEAYFKKAKVHDTNKLDVIYESLSGGAQDWAAIYQIAWENFDDFKEDFLRSYWSQAEQDKLRHHIATHRWCPKKGRSMEGHFAHYVGLAKMLTNPIPEDSLVSELMKHFPTNIQSLWQLKDIKSVPSAAEFLRQQESIFSPSLYPPAPSQMPTPPPNKRFRWEKTNVGSGEHRPMLEANPRIQGNGHRSS